MSRFSFSTSRPKVDTKNRRANAVFCAFLHVTFGIFSTMSSEASLLLHCLRIAKAFCVFEPQSRAGVLLLSGKSTNRTHTLLSEVWISHKHHVLALLKAPEDWLVCEPLGLVPFLPSRWETDVFLPCYVVDQSLEKVVQPTRDRLNLPTKIPTQTPSFHLSLNKSLDEWQTNTPGDTSSSCWITLCEEEDWKSAFLLWDPRFPFSVLISLFFFFFAASFTRRNTRRNRKTRESEEKKSKSKRKRQRNVHLIAIVLEQ